MTDKHNRFKHKWILDPELAKCKDTGIWCLTYIDGKGMFCGLCRLTNTLQPSNKSKIWNCQANTRCRTSTVKEHFHSKKGEKTMHRDAIATQKSKRGTYFVQKEKEEEESSSTTNEKVFTSLYWLCKEEIAHSKLNSLLALVESLGVDDMSQFTKRSNTVLRELLLIIGNQVKEDLVKKIKTSPFFGILTDEVTDISNIQHLVTFIKYYDAEKGAANTVFIDAPDILEFSETNSADSKTIHDCLIKMIIQLGLELKNLKAFSSDGASVMTGSKSGVAARLKENEVLKCLINIHCICHRLALACADSSNQLTFLNDFESNLIQLWAFFKNSAKRLNVYAKTALKMHDLDVLPKEKKKVVRKVKKAVCTRWLSLHASVDAIYDEYVGLLESLKLLENEGGAGGAIAKGFGKTLRGPKFLGMLYTLKVMLPSLTALSKTFQKGAITFSKIIPNVAKTKAHLQKHFENETPLKLLKGEVTSRLQRCNLVIAERDEESVKSITERYTKAMIWNIEERFQSDVLGILDAFGIFNLDSIPTHASSNEFSIYGNNEVKTLSEHFFLGDGEKQNDVIEEWNNFKFDLLSLRRKWIVLKENLAANKLKLQYTATEWALKQICTSTVDIDEYPIISSISKIAYITPVSNAWPERGGSAIKRIKTNSRSTMKDDALNALLMVSLNGPEPGTPDAKSLIRRAASKYTEKKRYKKAPVMKQKVVGTQTTTIETQTVYVESETLTDAEECLDAILNVEYDVISNLDDILSEESDIDEE